MKPDAPGQAPAGPGGFRDPPRWATPATLEEDVRAHRLHATRTSSKLNPRGERFRSVFFYRLNVVSITPSPPPGSEGRHSGTGGALHPEVQCSFAQERCRTPPGGPGPFQTYSWPGNVRELENVIERAVILNSKSRIMLEDLPPMVKVPQAGRRALARGDGAAPHRPGAAGDEGEREGRGGGVGNRPEDAVPEGGGIRHRYRPRVSGPVRA